MIDELSLLKSADCREIENREILKEIDNQNQFIMDLNIKKNSDRPVYRLCEVGESSKITFFKYSNFPDGIYFEISDERKIIFYIIEQKKAPTKDYKKLSKQLISGYIHAKSLSAILNISDEDISFNYYITYLEEPTETERYNAMSGRAPRITFGEALPPDHTFSLWKNSRVIYRNDIYSKEFNINKIKMTDYSEVDGFLNYQSQLNI